MPIVDCVQRPEDAEALPVIEGGVLTIGRGDDVILNLTDEARPSEAAGPGQPGQLVHRQHARVVLRGGAYWLDVQGRQMLTRVGSIAYRCVPGLPQLQLAHGDEIIFGGAPKGPDADYRRFRFVVDAPEALQPDREAHPLPQMPAQPVRRPVMPLETSASVPTAASASAVATAAAAAAPLHATAPAVAVAAVAAPELGPAAVVRASAATPAAPTAEQLRAASSAAAAAAAYEATTLPPVTAVLRGQGATADVPLATGRRQKTPLGVANSPAAHVIATRDSGFDLHVTQGGAVKLARRVIVRGFAEPTGAGGEWRELAAGAQCGLRSGDHVRVLGAHFICELPTSREQGSS